MAQTVNVIVTAEDRKRLLAIANDRSRRLKHIQRARIVLFSAERLPVLEVARRAGVSRPAVWRWRQRYGEEGVEGLLRDKTRKPGRAPLCAEVVAEMLALTCSEPPDEVTHWTGRAMAKAVGVSLRAVQRLWDAHRLQPHRLRTFKRSNDPQFAEKVEDVVGLYMDPPMHAVVVSIDEKSQIQALDRTQPGLPIKPGKCGTMTHDYKRKTASSDHSWPRPISPATRHLQDHVQRLLGAIGDALLEVSFDAPHLVRDVREAEHRPIACGGKGIERRRFHFDRQDAGFLGGRDRLGRLAKRRIRRPGGADLRRHARRSQGLLSKPDQALVGQAVLGGRQIVVARSFVSERPVDDDEIRRRLRRNNLACRCHTYKQLAARGEELLGDQNREGGADGAADNAIIYPLMFEGMEVGVIAGPQRRTASATRREEVAHNVAIRIEDADFRDGAGADALLPPRLPEESVRREDRRRRSVFETEDGRMIVGHAFIRDRRRG